METVTILSSKGKKLQVFTALFCTLTADLKALREFLRANNAASGDKIDGLYRMPVRNVLERGD
jgi:hypothetical protein